MSSARESAERLAALLAREHACLADFLEALVAFDRNRGWEELGYTSLFWFLHRELKLSRGAAHLRKVAVELLQEHPSLVEPLADGRLCLSTVGEVARVITAENATAIVPRFFHLSRREAAEVAAELQPVESPPRLDLVTTVHAAMPPVGRPSRDRDTDVVVHPDERNPRDESPRRPQAPSSPLVVPLTEELRRLHFTVSRRFLALLEVARDALSHSHPGASTETILQAGLELLIERHGKRRGVGAAPSTNPRPASNGRITADVKRRIWERDGGRCQWPIETGGTCGSTLRLEFDHVVPRGLGGASDASNVRLLRPLPQPACGAPRLRRRAHGPLWRRRARGPGAARPGADRAGAARDLRP